MTPADWKDNLAALLGNVELPQEPEETSTPRETERPKPRLTVTLDRKRAGKTATIVTGFEADDSRCAEVAKEMKRRLAVGGSSRGGEILVQGDRVDAVKRLLAEMGYKTNK